MSWWCGKTDSSAEFIQGAALTTSTSFPPHVLVTEHPPWEARETWRGFYDAAGRRPGQETREERGQCFSGGEQLTTGRGRRRRTAFTQRAALELEKEFLPESTSLREVQIATLLKLQRGAIQIWFRTRGGKWKVMKVETSAVGRGAHPEPKIVVRIPVLM
uniref:Homeobox domain-containing protein n=1 Tax=Xenopus tropicalis TaxID=8364 RepID=A0A803K7U5_XENTR